MKKHGVIFFIFLTVFHAKLFSQPTPHSEEQFKSYFEQHLDSLNQIEGIWSVTTTQNYYRHDTLLETEKIPRSIKVAILAKSKKNFETFDLGGELYNVLFTATEVKGVYFYKNYFPETNEYSETKAVISKDGEMEYQYDFPDNYLKKKLSDSYEENTRVTNVTVWIRLFPAKKKK
jgi:hypothetical protein